MINPTPDLAKISRILFVDDEPLVLDGIRRQLSLAQMDWVVEFAHSGQEALALMAKDPADVVVTDIAMPGMDGKELINRILEKYPDVVPVILSGHWSHLTAFNSFGARLRFLEKPVVPELLFWTVRQALIESGFLKNGPAMEAWVHPIETGQPSIDSGRKELNSFIEFIDSLFLENRPKEEILNAFNKYLKMIIALFPLEEEFLNTMTGEKIYEHIFIHKQHHKNAKLFILESIEGLTKNQECKNTLILIRNIFKNITRDMRSDDIEMSIIMAIEDVNKIDGNI